MFFFFSTSGRLSPLTRLQPEGSEYPLQLRLCLNQDVPVFPRSRRRRYDPHPLELVGYLPRSIIAYIEDFLYVARRAIPLSYDHPCDVFH